MSERRSYSAEEKYLNLLEEAKRTDLSDVWQSIGETRDNKNRPCVYFLPSLMLDFLSNISTKRQILHKMVLLFISIIDIISYHPFSIIYGYTKSSWFIQSYVHKRIHSILPFRYKDNLCQMFVLQPLCGAKLFFGIASFFVDKKFYSKLHFIENIATLQDIIHPLYLSLPSLYHQWEDNTLNIAGPSSSLSSSSCSSSRHFINHTRHMPSLEDVFDLNLGAPPLLVRCAEYMLSCVGIATEGVLRVAGDPGLFALAKYRMRFHLGEAILFQPQESRATAEVAVADSVTAIVDDGEEMVVGASVRAKDSSLAKSGQFSTSNLFPAYIHVISKDMFGSTAHKLVLQSEVSPNTVPLLSVITISDVDTAAQLLKAYIRELPVPLVTFAAYEQILPVTASLEHKAITRADWSHRVALVLRDMPLAHSFTLQYVLRSGCLCL